ncbi:hypothetical protein CON64_22665 [Bacillus pseudomycoides]|nr:hypothetical protein CON64_22665 [Bacillus pseudomycoides]
MSIKKGFSFETDELKQAEADEIAQEFLNDWKIFHSFRLPRDNELNILLHQSYADVFRRDKAPEFNGLPYFSPSSAGSCSRELHEKVKGSPKDRETTVSHHQTMWQNIGTAIGDTVQYQILLMERHFTKVTGQELRFKFQKNALQEPLFEEFSRTLKRIHHNGEDFYLYGVTDGIMLYKNSQEEVLRVGLEVKSKQTTYASTGYRNMKSANPKHVQQCVTYSMMYGVDYWVIVYVNGSKKAWEMSEEELEKYPYIRAFGIYVTDSMKKAVLDKFASVLKGVRENNPPLPSLVDWTFNNFKESIAKSLTEEEFLMVIEQAEQIEFSNLPAFKKKAAQQAIEFIAQRRGLDV